MTYDIRLYNPNGSCDKYLACPEYNTSGNGTLSFKDAQNIEHVTNMPFRLDKNK
jgi:hypothetical protein